jgi:hypothetical protein
MPGFGARPLGLRGFCRGRERRRILESGVKPQRAFHG